MIGASCDFSALERHFRAMRAELAASDAQLVEKGAEELAATIRAAAPYATGELASTVETIRKGPFEWLVVAGGRKTRKRVKAGKKPFYDRARAAEFGTKDAPAEPSFWPAYRRFKRKHRSRVNRARKAIFKKYSV